MKFLIALMVIVALYIGYRMLVKTEEIKEEDTTLSIKIEKVEEANHIDHWGAMYGFDDNLTEQGLNESVKELEFKNEIEQGVALFTKSYGKITNVALVKDEGKLITMFPELSTQKSMAVTVKTIHEWMPTDGWEAHISGGGEDTFGLGFFATDYAQNRDIYKKGGTLNMTLSAFAYVVEKSSMQGETVESNNSEDDTVTEMTFSGDFCGYFPSGQLDTGYDFDFVGKVLSIEDVEYRGEAFYLMEVRIVSDGEVEFVLPMAVNVKNVRTEKIDVGDNVSGAFWLQGKIIK